MGQLNKNVKSLIVKGIIAAGITCLYSSSVEAELSVGDRGFVKAQLEAISIQPLNINDILEERLKNTNSQIELQIIKSAIQKEIAQNEIKARRDDVDDNEKKRRIIITQRRNSNLKRILQECEQKTQRISKISNNTKLRRYSFTKRSI